jgi:transposase
MKRLAAAEGQGGDWCDARIAELEKQVVARVAELLARLEHTGSLLAKARETSATSSKPPSSDIVEPRPEKARAGRKRRIGDRPGHEKSQRDFCLQDADRKHPYDLRRCPCCDSPRLKARPQETKYLYQYELVERPVELHAHVIPIYGCDSCQEVRQTTLPSGVRKAGLIRPRRSRVLAYLNGACRSSYSNIRVFSRDVFGMKVSTGMIAKVIRKLTFALDDDYAELLNRLSNEAVLNVDETGHN